LNEIHHQREVARKARSAADHDRSIAQNLKQELAQRLEKIEEERLLELEKARQESETQVEAIKKELEEVRKELLRARQPLEALKSVQEKVELVEHKVSRPVQTENLSQFAGAYIPRMGDRVRMRTLNMEGTVTALGVDDVEIQVGNLRMRARLQDVMPYKTESVVPAELPRLKKKVRSAISTLSDTNKTTPFRATPGMEIDLRGQRAEDALEALDRYLDNAVVVGMPFVRIIHGKGTGRLRQVIREALQGNPNVSGFETGADNEGGEGVTVVHLDTK
jgi:DNA mismatch repair protein MutS2